MGKQTSKQASKQVRKEEKRRKIEESASQKRDTHLPN
jgi:hypothetical protein